MFQEIYAIHRIASQSASQTTANSCAFEVQFMKNSKTITNPLKFIFQQPTIMEQCNKHLNSKRLHFICELEFHNSSILIRMQCYSMQFSFGFSSSVPRTNKFRRIDVSFLQLLLACRLSVSRLVGWLVGLVDEIVVFTILIIFQ